MRTLGQCRGRADGVGTGLFIRNADLDGNGKMDLAVSGKTGTYLLFQK